jgi:hypothetical protein
MQDWPESSIKPRHSRCSSYGGEDSPMAEGHVPCKHFELERILSFLWLTSPRASVPKSAPSSPTFRFKSPGNALVSLSRQLLNEQSMEEQPLARQLPFDSAPARMAMPARVLRRPTAAASFSSAAPTRSGAAPARTMVGGPPAGPVLEHTRPRVTVPMGTNGTLPRFMQPTAAARSRVAPAEKKLTAVASSRNAAPYASQTARKPAAVVARRPTVPATENRRPAPENRRTENRKPVAAKPPTTTTNGITIPETPQWVRNGRMRQRSRGISTEEREMMEVAEKKRQLAEVQARNRQRLAAMQGAATYEQRMPRVASAFTPNKKAPVRQQRPVLTQPEPFQLSQRRR